MEEVFAAYLFTDLRLSSPGASEIETNVVENDIISYSYLFLCAIDISVPQRINRGPDSTPN